MTTISAANSNIRFAIAIASVFAGANLAEANCNFSPSPNSLQKECTVVVNGERSDTSGHATIVDASACLTISTNSRAPSLMLQLQYGFKGLRGGVSRDQFQIMSNGNGGEVSVTGDVVQLKQSATFFSAKTDTTLVYNKAEGSLQLSAERTGGGSFNPDYQLSLEMRCN